jgi:hypothetical protein
LVAANSAKSIRVLPARYNQATPLMQVSLPPPAAGEVEWIGLAAPAPVHGSC